MRKVAWLLSLLIPVTVQASNELHITITGMIYIKTSCSLTQPPEVDFGDILTTGIDNNDYEKPIDITLSCSNRNPLQSVEVRVDAPGASGNMFPVNGADGFELALLRNGAPQPLNTPFVPAADGPLNLSLQPVKKVGENYKLGDFRALATVTVEII
ncbi:fimbrial protein [Enterobacter mori]|uniref:fimbrial protein n=1 Tax=Enterobacter mori TaxID=539813 RepID=UPI002B20DF97|nr:fimbrial protein [Enterobacter mori]MEA5206348.1 fimbrial protein [Enterobacter mori]